MSNKFTQIYRFLPHFNSTYTRIANYILSNQIECKNITIKILAQRCLVSEATIIRFIKKVGFSSFPQFKISLAEYLSTQNIDNTPVSLYEDINQKDSIKDIIEKVYHYNTHKILDLKNTLNLDSINQAVKLIDQATCLMFVGTGASSIAIEEAVLRFMRVNKTCIHWKDQSLQMINASLVSEKTVLITISDTGRTKHIIDVVSIAKKNKAKIIAITSGIDSPISKLSDILLLTQEYKTSNKETLNWESSSTKIQQLMIIDILYAAYAVLEYQNTINSLSITSSALKKMRE